MTMLPVYLASLCLVLSTLLTGCYGKQYPPYIRNETDRPVFVSIEYSAQEPPVEGVMAPRTNAGHATGGRRILGLSFHYEGRPEYGLQESDLELLRDQAHHPEPEVWLLTEDGVSLGGKDAWEKIRADRLRHSGN